MNDSVRERIVRNNYTFREANEQIRARADEYDAPIERIPFCVSAQSRPARRSCA